MPTPLVVGYFELSANPSHPLFTHIIANQYESVYYSRNSLEKKKEDAHCPQRYIYIYIYNRSIWLFTNHLRVCHKSFLRQRKYKKIISKIKNKKIKKKREYISLRALQKQSGLPCKIIDARNREKWKRMLLDDKPNLSLMFCDSSVLIWLFS